MSKKNSKIEHFIREYLLDEGFLREKITDPKLNLDFGFIFAFPSGQRGQRMSVFKPKNKNLIIISIRIQLSKPHSKALNSLEDDKNIQFFSDLRKYFLMKEVFFQIDIQNYRYEINDQLYLDNEGIVSKDSFFKTIRKVYYCFIFSNILLKEYCSGKEIKTKEFDSFDFSLYM